MPGGARTPGPVVFDLPASVRAVANFTGTSPPWYRRRAAPAAISHRVLPGTTARLQVLTAGGASNPVPLRIAPAG